jgi:hypothetical protein
MPATAVLLPIAETFGLGTLGTLGTAGGLGAAVTGLSSSTLVASTVGGAIIGAGEGALNAAIQGGDIAKGALTGGVGGGVGAGVSQEVGQALGQTAPLPEGTQGPSAPATIAGSPEAGSAAVGAASQGAGTLASALAGGQPISTALQSAIQGAGLGGIGGLTSGIAKYDFGADAGTAGEIGTAAKSLAGYALPSTSGAPSVSAGSTPSYTPPVQPGLSLQGPTTAAPSPTLGQSLSIAPTLGYTPTGAVFGSSDDSGQKQNVWNVGSLRNIGSAES